MPTGFQKQDMKINNTYKPTVSAIIKNGSGNILLTHNKSHASDFWKFPQGAVELGETEDAAILREMEEELGTGDLIITKKCQTKYSYEWPSDVQSKKGFLGPSITYFILKCPEGVVLSPNKSELDKIKWVDVKTLESLFKNVPGFLETFNKLLLEINQG